MFLLDFNSIKVQLEQDNPREVCVKLDNFNSIKVQLEPWSITIGNRHINISIP